MGTSNVYTRYHNIQEADSSESISSNWIWNFVVVMITPSAIDNLKWKTYLIFMVTNIVFIPVVYFFYPETSNLTLEEVDYLFTSASSDPPRTGRFAKLFKPTDEVLLSFEYRKLKAREGDGAVEEMIAERNPSVSQTTEKYDGPGGPGSVEHKEKSNGGSTP